MQQEVDVDIVAIAQDWGWAFAVAVALAAPWLREQFGKGFASISMLNAATQRVDKDHEGAMMRIEMIERSLEMFDERLSEKRDRIIRLEEQDRHQTERIAETIVVPMRRIAERLDEYAVQLTRTATTLESVATRMERLEKRLDRAERDGRT